jgi:hypothetical protein
MSKLPKPKHSRQRLVFRHECSRRVFREFVYSGTVGCVLGQNQGHCEEPCRWAKLMPNYGRTLGFTPMPPLGPFRLGQHNGMMQAIMLEMRAMEPGKKNSTVQFGTTRKLRGTSTVLWEALPASGADIILSAGNLKGRYIATLCPSEGRWYDHFSTGISTRMGDIVHQDRAYTLANNVSNCSNV